MINHSGITVFMDIFFLLKSMALIPKSEKVDIQSLSTNSKS